MNYGAKLWPRVSKIMTPGVKIMILDTEITRVPKIMDKGAEIIIAGVKNYDPSPKLWSRVSYFCFKENLFLFLQKIMNSGAKLWSWVAKIMIPGAKNYIRVSKMILGPDFGQKMRKKDYQTRFFRKIMEKIHCFSGILSNTLHTRLPSLACTDIFKRFLKKFHELYVHFFDDVEPWS